MLDLLKKICPLPLAPVSPGADKAAEILREELPFKIREYQSGSEHNGWTVLQSWEVIKAEIRQNGRLIYDGKKNPLGVMGYAKSFRGKVTLDELKHHLSYRKDLPQAIGYHCDYFYKPWKSDWGFNVPFELYQSLKEAEYEVVLQTSFSPGTMKVLDYSLKGSTSETIFFNAHNCHAAQANDDIAGIVVGVEVMKRLARKKNRFTYRLIVAPEHLGTVFFMASLTKAEIGNLKCGFFLEMLGNENRFALQKSFTGTADIDRAASCYFAHSNKEHFIDDFRKIIGNDETVWEAPGYEIPTVSLSRWPYPEYHTSLDNESIISESRLEESVVAVLKICEILETNSVMKRKFDGLISLSNPRYDLYLPAGTDPSQKTEGHAEQLRKWNYLMDCLPRYFDQRTSILDIAIKHDLPYESVHSYIEKFKDRGLIEFKPLKMRKLCI